MKLSDIKNLINAYISFEVFKNAIADEIFDYKERMRKKGASNPIFLDQDIDSLIDNERSSYFLCKAFMSKMLNEWELNYLAEALLLSDNTLFDDDKTSDALLALTDADYFTGVNNNYVQSIIGKVSS